MKHKQNNHLPQNAEISIKKKNSTDKIIALAGNPNVGKSSIFNKLTGLKQHTGNWPGKTVTNASGICLHKGKRYILVDIPGSYSLNAHSKEEEVARDFLCIGNPDAVVVVCDASCLERNMGLVLQALEITKNVIVCVNLVDEAKKRGIFVNIEKLSQKLGTPVISTIARSGKGLDKLMDAIEQVCKAGNKNPYRIKYTAPIETAITIISDTLENNFKELPARKTAIALLENDKDFLDSLCSHIGRCITQDDDIKKSLSQAKSILHDNNIAIEKLSDTIASLTVLAAEDVCNGCFSGSHYRNLDRTADKILTGRKFGIPIMIVLLCIVFYITLYGANIPSAFLSQIFLQIENSLLSLCLYLNIPEIIYSPLIFGVYHVLTWVISVMLPPMAIFFPLFTLLEDLGYLPRIAFNLDHCLKRCSACGKQALTMCMGFGCNAAGVVGCRIIDSPRERLIAILTNAFVPCNGRFPTLISIITMFFIYTANSITQSILGALVLTSVVLFGIFMTFLASNILSKTLLKGEPSSFSMELPPYRRPQLGSILVHSITDRTLFVLSRAISVAAPAGLIIWLFANIKIEGMTLLLHCTTLLDPIAHIFGLDGTILFAFILGFPANEIVIPLIIMSYSSGGILQDASNLLELKALLIANGWTYITAANVLIFSLMHWPCSTTLMTIKKETGSVKWTLLAAILPTAFGLLLCFLFTTFAKIF